MISNPEYSWLAFSYAINPENYIDHSNPNIAEEIANRENPEKLLLRKEKITKMSKEAQEIVRIIINAPQEMIDMISLNRDHISSMDLKKYLKNKGWKLRVILKTFSEIKRMLKEN
ncbi:hypothetical protein GW932_05375 [archaeon]|nr:hypothetical protein [archaeon]